jgi:hypothetical protein
VVGAIWLYTVATLLRANVQLSQILSDMLSNKYLQPWLRERIYLINVLYQSNANFGALLLKLNLNFPDKELLEELSVYATLPDFYEHLHEISKDWLDEGVEHINEQSNIINTVLGLCVSCIICFIVLSIGSLTLQFTDNF